MTRASSVRRMWSSSPPRPRRCRRLQPQIGPLIGDDTLVIFPQNGMTWWYPLGLAVAVSEAARTSDLRTCQAVPCSDAAGSGARRHHLFGERGRLAGRDQEQLAQPQPAGICAIGGERAGQAFRDPRGARRRRHPLARPGDIRAALWTKLRQQHERLDDRACDPQRPRTVRATIRRCRKSIGAWCARA